MKRTHIILDEAASLGQLECIDDAIDKYRGYGIRLQFYFQSMGQLKKCFPEGQDETLLANCSQVFFGCNTPSQADYITSRLGEFTAIVESGGSSWGNSSNWSSGQQPSEGGGWSYNASKNWQQQARKLLKPEEIMTLDPRLAITLAPGMPPILTRLARYYEEPKLGRRPGWIKRSFTACCVLIASAVFCAATLGTAAILTVEGQRAVRPQDVPVLPRSVFGEDVDTDWR